MDVCLGSEPDFSADAPATLIELIDRSEAALVAAGVSFGHGTTNARDEAIWLVLWTMGLPLDTPLDDPLEYPDSMANRPVKPMECAGAATILGARINTRKPAAYLTREA